MRRPIPPGTPTRSPRYMMPGNRSRFIMLSIAAPLMLLGVAIVLYGAGFHDLASPGPLIAPHTKIDVSSNRNVGCAQCHQPAKAVVDLRCERCHDPIDSRRFGSPAHAVLAGGGAYPASHTAPVECVACHTDHGGRALDLKRVADERCASCHQFNTLSRHPEFAQVRAKQDPDTGLDFSHETHLKEVAKIGADKCQACHQAPTGASDFDPISFDTHCAKCHVKNGVLSPDGRDGINKSLPLARAVLLPQTPVALLLKDAAGNVVEETRRDVKMITLQGFAHRDTWVLANINRLTTSLAAGRLASERRRLSEQLARLSAIAGEVPLAGLSDADLTAWNASLVQEVAALDRQIAAGPSAAPETAAGLDAVARAIDPALAPLVAQVGGARPSTVDPSLGRPADAQQVDERRREIEQLLDAVSSRNNSALSARAADLKKRLAGVKADTQSAAPATGALGDRVNFVEAALRAVESAASESMAAEVRGLEDAIRQQMAGGLDPAAAAAGRAQLVTMLDSLSTRSTPALRTRIAELRAAVVPLFEGARDDLRGRRDQKARLLDRIALERALRRDNGTILVDAKTNAERTSATREMRLIQARIAELDRASAATVDVSPADGQRALQALFAACSPCHLPNQDKTALRSVVAGRPRLTSATFTHKTHQQQACETCHATIATSKTGTDVNLPGVVSCQSCHNASQARADCVSCHQYHPRSAAELVVASR